MIIATIISIAIALGLEISNAVNQQAYNEDLSEASRINSLLQEAFSKAQAKGENVYNKLIDKINAASLPQRSPAVDAVMRRVRKHRENLRDEASAELSKLSAAQNRATQQLNTVTSTTASTFNSGSGERDQIMKDMKEKGEKDVSQIEAKLSQIEKKL